jgi:hypothetical protein
MYADNHDARSSGIPQRRRRTRRQDEGHPFPPVKDMLQARRLRTHFTAKLKQVITQMVIFAD